MDDSDGSMGELLDRLQDIHLTACKAAKPDPQALAKRLFDWELHGDWDTFRDAVLTYAEVLGDKGLKHYRELAEAAWAAVPTLGPGDGNSDRYRRFNIKHIMETLAQAGGGLDELIAVKQRDLSSSYTFLEIAQACRQAGAEDRALAWAEKGVAGSPRRRLHGGPVARTGQAAGKAAPARRNLDLSTPGRPLRRAH